MNGVPSMQVSVRRDAILPDHIEIVEDFFQLS
jgi:hypothetical protein